MACNKDLQNQGVAYPRTCAECGKGPCKKSRPPSTEERFGAKPSDNYEDLIDTCKQFAMTKRRITELEHALQAVGDKKDGLRCSLLVAEGTAWEVEVPMLPDAARSVLLLALDAQKLSLGSLNARLNAARKALQA